MKRYYVSVIEWDIDDEEVYGLPTNALVKLGDLEDPCENISDILSDRHGFCVKSCNFEELEGEK